jgi:hemoglobin/transferrin/lactoferrin receptor protein
VSQRASHTLLRLLNGCLALRVIALRRPAEATALFFMKVMNSKKTPLLQLTPVAAAFFSALSAVTAVAQTGVENDAIAQRLEPVVVTGSRAARASGDVPATATVIDAQEIENKRIENVRDLVRDEPAITVRKQPARFTVAGSGVGRDNNAGFNIRGIDGNRVLILLDGIRIPSAFSFGATNVGRGDYVDLGTLSRAEILRGPASALYGSDGLAGAVSFFTRDPSDLLKRTGRDTYASINGAYSGDDDSWTSGGSAATRFDKLELMASVSHTDASELKNFGEVEGNGSSRTAPNPATSKSDSGLVKWVYRYAPDAKIAVTLDAIRRSTDTDVLTGRIPVAGPPGVDVANLAANDDLDRTRGLLRWSQGSLNAMMADRIEASAYYQDGRNRQYSVESRSNGVTRIRDQRYDERIAGLAIQAEREIVGTVSQRWVYGLDFSRSTAIGVSDGTLPPAGETFPTKRFPDTAYSLLGVYAQNEIGFADNRFLVIPALRFDRYELRPEASPQFPSGAPAAASDSQLSPKLGFVWKFARGHTAFINVASGFKAPAPNQVNQGFTNVVSNYASIANPDLKPESNVSVEIGAKKFSGALTYEFAAFAGRYKDFIEQIQLRGSFTAASPAIFQFVNLTKAELRGSELKLRYDFANGVFIRAAAAYVTGDSEVSGINTPLASVEPLRANTGVGFNAPNRTWGAELSLAYQAQKSASVTPTTTQFRPPASTVLDFNAYWSPLKHVKLTFAAYNLTNRKYWNWSDVQGLVFTSTILDAYTQAPRHISAGLRWEF